MSVAIAGFAVSFAIGGLVPSAAFASVPRLAPEPRAIGPINGLLAQAGSLGSLAGPPALALWVELAGWAWAPLMLLAVAGRRRGQRRPCRSARFSTTIIQILPGVGASRPRESTG